MYCKCDVAVSDPDDLYTSDDPDFQAPYKAHVQVSKIRLQVHKSEGILRFLLLIEVNAYVPLFSEEHSPEDEEARIPCESWIPSCLQEHAKNAMVLLTPGIIDNDNNNDNNGGSTGRCSVGADDWYHNDPQSEFWFLSV